MKTFANEWIYEPFAHHPSFFTKRMFGGLAVYLFGRMMMCLVEPTRSGRSDWHGVMICTSHPHQPSLIAEFPILRPHHRLKKWLYVETRCQEFESTMTEIARAVARNDTRFGIAPAHHASAKKA
ncbi:MAG: hypothetical protein ABL995_11100 [Bryobacteraceae bacterium]